MAGIDLLTGHVHALVKERHRIVASLLHMTKPCEWDDTTPRRHLASKIPPNQPTACSTYRPDPVSVYKSTRPN
jgi:hypothetical protein